MCLKNAVSSFACFARRENRDIYFVREEDDGSKTTGPVITGGVKIFSFAEDANVREF